VFCFLPGTGLNSVGDGKHWDEVRVVEVVLVVFRL
jgi:hypothetical protein